MGRPLEFSQLRAGTPICASGRSYGRVICILTDDSGRSVVEYRNIAGGTVESAYIEDVVLASTEQLEQHYQPQKMKYKPCPNCKSGKHNDCVNRGIDSVWDLECECAVCG